MGVAELWIEIYTCTMRNLTKIVAGTYEHFKENDDFSVQHCRFKKSGIWTSGALGCPRFDLFLSMCQAKLLTEAG